MSDPTPSDPLILVAPTEQGLRTCLIMLNDVAPADPLEAKTLRQARQMTISAKGL